MVPPQLGDDVKGERVTADAGKVFTQQASRSRTIACGGAAHHLDVVPLPTHLLAIGEPVRRSGEGAQIGDRHSKVRVGVECEAQRRHCLRRIGGSLGLAVERGGLPVCGDHPAVVVNCWAGLGEAITVAGLAWGWLHRDQVERVA